MNRKSALLITALLGAGLGVLPGCGSGGGAAAPARSDTGDLVLVHVPSLGQEHYPDLWEVLRGLYRSGPARVPRQEVSSPGRPGRFGHLNGHGGLTVEDTATLLADPETAERVARACGAVRIDAFVPAADLAAPAGQEALRRGYRNLGRVYNLDGHHLVRTFPDADGPAGELPAGWRIAPEDARHRQAAPAFAYQDLPEDLKPGVDRQLAELDGHFAYFLRRRTPGSPVLGGIVARDLPRHGYGHGLYVAEFWASPGIRHRSQGRLLMDATVRWAGDHGVQVVSLWTHQGLAYPFYERYGFRRSVTVPEQVPCEGGARLDLYEYILERHQFGTALANSRRRTPEPAT